MYALTLAGVLKTDRAEDVECNPARKRLAAERPACFSDTVQVHGPNRVFSGTGNMPGLAKTLATNVLDRNVLDWTGMDGRYTIRLEYTPDDNTPKCIGMPEPFALPELCQVRYDSDVPPAGSIFSAVQRLGLKLEPIKGPRQHIVIDHVWPPSQN